MSILLFYIFYGYTWLVSQIPSKAIHRVSDLTYLILYYLVRYRRKVVRKNLINSFPEKDSKEIVRIEKRFYRHLCDLVFENFMLLHASRKRALRRCDISNLKIFDELAKEGKSVIIATGHYGNWELLSLAGSTSKHIPVGIYKPINNKRFERLLNNSRKRFGGVPVAMKDTLRAMVKYRQQNKPILLGLIADQTPASGDIRYWTTFLNQDTPVFLGIEKLAKKFNYPVYFCSIDKIRRGKYKANFILLSEKPKDEKPYEITEKYIKTLENIIKEKPEYWLWSHRRWKRKRVDKSNQQE